MPKVSNFHCLLVGLVACHAELSEEALSLASCCFCFSQHLLFIIWAFLSPNCHLHSFPNVLSIVSTKFCLLFCITGTFLSYWSLQCYLSFLNSLLLKPLIPGSQKRLLSCVLCWTISSFIFVYTGPQILEQGILEDLDFNLIAFQ